MIISLIGEYLFGLGKKGNRSSLCLPKMDFLPNLVLLLFEETTRKLSKLIAFKFYLKLSIIGVEFGAVNPWDFSAPYVSGNYRFNANGGLNRTDEQIKRFFIQLQIKSLNVIDHTTR